MFVNNKDKLIDFHCTYIQIKYLYKFDAMYEVIATIQILMLNQNLICISLLSIVKLHIKPTYIAKTLSLHILL